MSRKMYTAEGIAEILINLPNDNSVDTDVEEDWDETDADITIDNLPPPVDSTADSPQEMESLEAETLNDSEEDQPHEHAPESRHGNNENGDNNTQNQNDNSAIPAPVNYEVNQQRLWKKREKQETGSEFNLPQGPIKDHFSDCISEVDYFIKFFDAEIRERILCETNLYINLKHRRISAVTNNELFSFLRITLLMEYHSLPSLRNYWSSEQDFNVPLFSSALSRNRFQQLLTN